MSVVFRTHMSMLLFLLAELWLTESGLSGLMASVAFTVATSVVATAALLLAAVAARSSGPLTPTRIRTAIRDRELRTAFLAQRDPDARGRRRPRAPGRSVLTAA
ncbi:DUF6412 domain-containing protein [Streptomyces hesseae]|uniref:DUF6412 domain-containing protein n=1 Tax=Streptomyces hesseae TaxID=3075519 RepID=A0ABU2SQ57_9ACTN|nr:DUF6412 domain-containing protein [Streptomyces sp. DSM 40473]MDT0450469.1 DUF6412 domain-containing protein [Streptomyces sp. DSM 40473]